MNADNGVKLRYPDRWTAVPPEQGSDVLQYFLAPGGDVAAGVLVNPAGSETLESYAPQIRDAMLERIAEHQDHQRQSRSDG